MVACAHCHTHLVNDGTQVIGMDAINNERNQTRTMRCFSYETDAVDLR